ncbi:MAG TPA: nucleotidyltransferase domain-containing protein [Candidatus Nanoarchaeia archaeon]|nr:nucleotidyltransferase domain-containing protein [Candidatus Nanoarchaeia archaeon]
MSISKIKQKILNLDQKGHIKFIFLYGSVAEKRNTLLSDIDIAVYYKGSSAERFTFRKKALGNLPDKVDLQIFQDLPLVVQKEVIAGKPIYAPDEEFMISECIKVTREFSAFEKYYTMYIEDLKEEAAA